MGKLQVGQAQSYGRPGDRVWVRVGDKDIPAQAASEINSSNVLLTTDEQGKVRAVTSTSPELLRSQTTTFTKSEPQIQPKEPVTGLLKVLFSVVKDNEEIFYVGGDREEPVEICSLPYREQTYASSIGGRGVGTIQATGAGLDDFLISIYYSDPNATEECHKRAIITRSPSGTLKATHNWQIDNLPLDLEHLGNAVWSIPASRGKINDILGTDANEGAFRQFWRRSNYKPLEPIYIRNEAGVRISVPSAIVYGEVSKDSENKDAKGKIEWFEAAENSLFTTTERGGKTYTYLYPQKLTPNIFRESRGSDNDLWLMVFHVFQTLLITPGQRQVFYRHAKSKDSLWRMIEGKEGLLPVAYEKSLFFGHVIYQGRSMARNTAALGDAIYQVSYEEQLFTNMFIKHQFKTLPARLDWSKELYKLLRQKNTEVKWAGIAIHKIEASGDTPLIKTVTPEAMVIPQAEEGEGRDDTFFIHEIAYFPPSD